MERPLKTWISTHLFKLLGQEEGQDVAEYAVMLAVILGGSRRYHPNDRIRRQ